MALKPMYAAVNNSPQTQLSLAVTAADTSIAVMDTSAFPPAPNLATLGNGDHAEVILYNGVTDGRLTDCVRGYNGTTARLWPAETLICRAFTAYDHDTFKENLSALDADKLGVASPVTDNTVAATQAARREPLSSGESLGTAFGKLMKWLADLGALAFKSKVTNADLDAGAVSNAVQASMPAHTLKGNASAAESPPGDLSAAQTRALLGVSENADNSGAAIYQAEETSSLSDAEYLPVSASAASLKKLSWASLKSLLGRLYAPLSHASLHAVSGADPVTPASIGAAAAQHDHAITAVTGLEAALDGKQPAGSYLTQETDPTVPAWAKAAAKPTYTAAEVGAASPAQLFTATLTAAGWVEGAQTVSVSGMTADAHAIVALAQSATQEQAAAAAGATLLATAQAAGSVTVTAYGTTPTMDIPITILIVG